MRGQDCRMQMPFPHSQPGIDNIGRTQAHCVCALGEMSFSIQLPDPDAFSGSTSRRGSRVIRIQLLLDHCHNPFNGHVGGGAGGTDFCDGNVSHSAVQIRRKNLRPPIGVWRLVSLRLGSDEQKMPIRRGGVHQSDPLNGDAVRVRVKFDPAGPRKDE